MKSTDFIYKCLWSIVNHIGKVDGHKLNEEFYRATNYKIGDFFEISRNDLIKFVGSKPNMFSVDQKT